LRLVLTSMAVLALSLLALPSIAADAADSRVKDALENGGLKYEIDSDNDYKLLMQLESNRTQIVYVNSATETYDAMEIREVWGPSFPSKGKQFHAKIANMLLLDSQQKKLGAWQGYSQNKSVFAVFNVKISADSDAESLKSAIWYVAKAADTMELMMTGKDDF